MINLSELFQTPAWQRLEAKHAYVEANIVEYTAPDFVFAKTELYREGRLLVGRSFNGITPNQKSSLLDWHRKEVWKAFTECKPVPGWVLQDDYPDFIRHAESKNAEINYRALGTNGQAGYYRLRSKIN